MPRGQRARKPEGAQEGFKLPSWVLKLVLGILVVAAIIGISVVLSPKSPAPAPASPVVKLDDSSFVQFLTDNPSGAMVEFSKRDCKFCVKLAPKYEEAAKIVKANGGPPFASVDSTAGAKVVEALKIDKFPHVVWFWRGEVTMEFHRAAEKTTEEIVEWANTAAGSAVQEMENGQDILDELALLRDALGDERKLFVAYNRTDHPTLRVIVEAAAQKYRAGSLFLFVTEPVESGPLIRAYGKVESSDAELGDNGTEHEVLPWVKVQVEAMKLAALQAKLKKSEEMLAKLDEARLKAEQANATGDNTTSEAEAKEPDPPPLDPSEEL